MSYNCGDRLLPPLSEKQKYVRKNRILKLWSPSPSQWLLCPYSTYINVYNSSIHYSPKLKQPKCSSVSIWLNKLWYIHAMECYLATEKNELLIHNDLDEFQRNHVVKKANPQSLHATWFNLCKFWKWQTYRNGEHISGCLGWGDSKGWEGAKRAMWGAFVVLKLFSILTVVVDTGVYTHDKSS